MIRRLRRNFIIVAMCSVLAVLAVIVCSLNVASYQNAVNRADRILNMLAENDGHFPDNAPFERRKEQERERLQPGDGSAPFRGMSPETPYDTRFFSVHLTDGGELISVDTGRIAAVESDEAVSYAGQVWKTGKTSGFLGDYRFLRQQTQDGVRIIFVDCGKEMDAFRELALTSAGVSCLGMAAVFILVFFFSRRVFAPVEESYLRQKRFVTDASHELKTPLAVISANVDLLEMEGGADRWTGSIRSQVRRLQNLTEQMVTLSRMEEEIRPVFTRCDLSGLVREAEEAFEPLARAAGKTMTVSAGEGICCQGDEERLRQMLSLLLDNALKYTPKDGEIRLKLETARNVKKNARIRLSVWNTVDGESGIKPGAQDILFERFYRTDASRNSGTGGSGIGLSIVKAIVDMHRGKVTAASEDGRSVCFTVTLHSF